MDHSMNYSLQNYLVGSHADITSVFDREKPKTVRKLRSKTIWYILWKYYRSNFKFRRTLRIHPVSMTFDEGEVLLDGFSSKILRNLLRQPKIATFRIVSRLQMKKKIKICSKGSFFSFFGLERLWKWKEVHLLIGRKSEQVVIGVQKLIISLENWGKKG